MNSIHQKPHLWVVGALISDGEGRLLLTQRPEGKKHAGKWEFPGGKVEPGENPRHALEREIAEELACQVKAGSVYEILHHDYGDFSVTLLFFTCRVIDGSPTAIEAPDIRWVTPHEMKTIGLLEADAALPEMFESRFSAFDP